MPGIYSPYLTMQTARKECIHSTRPFRPLCLKWEDSSADPTVATKFGYSTAISATEGGGGMGQHSTCRTP